MVPVLPAGSIIYLALATHSHAFTILTRAHVHIICMEFPKCCGCMHLHSNNNSMGILW